MSITHTDQMSCPKCQATVELFVADSLNAGRHPHLRELLVERRLHVFTCGVCNEPFSVEKELVYVDFPRRQLLGLFPSTERVRERRCGEQLLEAFRSGLQIGAPAFIRDLSKHFLVRVCFGYEELREKVVADAAGLYDLALEAFKAELLVEDPFFREAGVITLRLDRAQPETLWLYPEWPDGARPKEQLAIPRARYDAVLARGTDAILGERPFLASGPHVSLLRAAFI